MARIWCRGRFRCCCGCATRDLLSNEAAPWSKYLLSSDQSFENNLDKGGRYSGLEREVDENEAEAAQLKAMARMELLEKPSKYYEEGRLCEE